jgi:hypothetical protein
MKALWLALLDILPFLTNNCLKWVYGFTQLFLLFVSIYQGHLPLLLPQPTRSKSRTKTVGLSLASVVFFEFGSDLASALLWRRWHLGPERDLFTVPSSSIKMTAQTKLVRHAKMRRLRHQNFLGAQRCNHRSYHRAGAGIETAICLNV